MYVQTLMVYMVYFGYWKHAIRNGIDFHNFGTQNSVLISMLLVWRVVLIFMIVKNEQYSILRFW